MRAESWKRGCMGQLVLYVFKYIYIYITHLPVENRTAIIHCRENFPNCGKTYYSKPVSKMLTSHIF